MKTKTCAPDFSGTTFKRLLYETVHRGPLSVEQLAERIGKSPSYLYRATLPDGGETDSGIPISVEAWDKVLHATQDLQSARYLLAGHGCVVFCLPSGAAGTRELASRACRAIKEFGDLAQAFGTVAADGTITRKEAELVEREGLEAVREIVALIEQVKGAVK